MSSYSEPVYKKTFLLLFIVLIVRPMTYAGEAFPEISANRNEIKDLVEAAIKKRSKLSSDDHIFYVNQITNYLAFLGLPTSASNNDFLKSTLNRLLNSSTQFLVCDDLDDWTCLEDDPVLIPSSNWRKPTIAGLGSPIRSGIKLNIEAYFTKRWFQDLEKTERSEITLADVLKEKINIYGKRNIWMAIFGMDDIHESIAPVFNEILQKLKDEVPVKGIFDAQSPQIFQDEKVLFSYFQPETSIMGNWLFSVSALIKVFQYSGTSELMQAMNSGIQSEMDSVARLEWTPNDIMHNKFFVFEKTRISKSVWTGTTNLSRTCMGNESNSNMSVFIQNNKIAQAYLDEFNEMYEFSDQPYTDSNAQILNGQGGSEIVNGKFHNDKKPNTNRYFTFMNGTEVRLHFSPTDDGEHRAIIPMVLSAEAGDVIRVSMFGGAGIELVRAFQYAVAKGATVKILMDRLTGSTVGAWNNNSILITSENPYLNLVDREGKAAGTLEFRYDDWPGLNHHKTGTLSRKLSKGGYLAETIIVGSQNWSASGNDSNDENMLTIRNSRNGVDVALQFNQRFDNEMWPHSSEKVPTATQSLIPVSSENGL